MVAQFKEMRLPRPPMFNTKPTTSTKSDHSHSPPPTQSKATKRSGKHQAVPGRSSNPKAPTSAASLNQRPVLSKVDTNLPSLRPPGLGSEKTTPPVSKPSAPRTAPKMPQSAQSPIHSSMQKAGAKPSTSPSNNRAASTGTDLASVSVASAPTQVDVDEPLLFVSCFHSLEEEDPEMGDEDELSQTVEVTSDLESQVAQIFGAGLGFVSEDEVVRHGEIAPPKVTPEVVLAPTLEPMSAVVELWEPTVNPAIESKGETDGSEAIPLGHQNQIACMPSTDIGKPSLALPCQPSQPTSVVGFDVALPRTVPRQPPSSADFEFVASLCQGAFCSIALCIHKQSRRQCTVKIISNVVLEDQKIVRAVLAEQRIMREVSRYPFLLGLLASFRGVHGLYLVSVSLLFPLLCDI
jgi:hypothetical protein